MSRNSLLMSIRVCCYKSNSLQLLMRSFTYDDETISVCFPTGSCLFRLLEENQNKQHTGIHYSSFLFHFIFVVVVVVQTKQLELKEFCRSGFVGFFFILAIFNWPLGLARRAASTRQSTSVVWHVLSFILWRTLKRHGRLVDAIRIRWRWTKTDIPATLFWQKTRSTPGVFWTKLIDYFVVSCSVKKKVSPDKDTDNKNRFSSDSGSWIKNGSSRWESKESNKKTIEKKRKKNTAASIGVMRAVLYHHHQQHDSTRRDTRRQVGQEKRKTTTTTTAEKEVEKKRRTRRIIRQRLRSGSIEFV